MSNKFVFIVLRDQTDIIQCVVKQEEFPEMFEEASKLTNESSLALSGTIKEDKRAPTGYEISVAEMERSMMQWMLDIHPYTVEFKVEGK